MVERNKIDTVKVEKRKQISDEFTKAGTSPGIVFEVLSSPKMIELYVSYFTLVCQDFHYKAKLLTLAL